MAMSVAMKRKLPVAATLKDINLKELALASGIPYRTLYRWREDDRVPGRETTQRLRFDHLKASADKLRAEKAAQHEAA